MTTSVAIQQMAVKASLKELFSRSSFSICRVTDICDVLDRPTNLCPQEMAILRTLHCVDYKDMEPELRAELPTMVLRVIGYEFATVVEDAKVWDMDGHHLLEAK